MAVNVYTGDIQIEDANFDLKADRFIIREGELSLAFSGSDEFGYFDVEGVAKSKGEFYMASKLDLKYSQYSGTDTASIKFDSVERINGTENCSIKGFWIQDGKNWLFTANLKKYNTS